MDYPELKRQLEEIQDVIFANPANWKNNTAADCLETLSRLQQDIRDRKDLIRIQAEVSHLIQQYGHLFPQLAAPVLVSKPVPVPIPEKPKRQHRKWKAWLVGALVFLFTTPLGLVLYLQIHTTMISVRVESVTWKRMIYVEQFKASGKTNRWVQDHILIKEGDRKTKRTWPAFVPSKDVEVGSVRDGDMVEAFIVTFEGITGTYQYVADYVFWTDVAIGTKFYVNVNLLGQVFWDTLKR
jgi:hypothetical protein